MGFDEEKVKTSVGELGTVITGNTPSKSKDEYWDSEDICFIKPDGIADAGITYISKSSEYMSEAAREKARVVTKDAIFVTCIGSIGKIGIAEDGEFAFNQQINSIIPNDRVIPKYLAYNLLYSKTRLSAIANSAVVPIINKSQFSEFEIKIIEDKAKQGRIVDGLDFVARIIDKRKQQLEELDTLIKARFVELFGNPLDGIAKYTIHHVGDVAEAVDPQPSHRTPPVQEGGIPYVSIKDCDYKTGKFDFEGARKVNKKVLEEHLNRYTLHDGDFIIGKIGTIGKPIFVPIRTDYTLSANVVLVQPNSELVSPYFLKYSFESDFVERQFFEAKNSTSQAAFGIQKVRAIEVMNPNLDVQREFEEFAKQIDKSKFDEFHIHK